MDKHTCSKQLQQQMTTAFNIQHSILNNDSDFKCDKNSNLFYFLPSYDDAQFSLAPFWRCVRCIFLFCRNQMAVTSYYYAVAKQMVWRNFTISPSFVTFAPCCHCCCCCCSATRLLAWRMHFRTHAVRILNAKWISMKNYRIGHKISNVALISWTLRRYMWKSEPNVCMLQNVCLQTQIYK